MIINVSRTLLEICELNAQRAPITKSASQKGDQALPSYWDLQEFFSIALLLLFLTHSAVIGWQPVVQHGCLGQSICDILVNWFLIDHVGALPNV